MVNSDRTKPELIIQPSILMISQTASDVSQFGEVFRVLLRWNGSIYKLAWKQMLVYFGLFYLLTLLREGILNDEGKRVFDAISKYCTRHSSAINMVVLLGFFTTIAMQRLFSIQASMPGTAKIIIYFISAIKPNLPEGSIIVEQFARWAVLAWILTFRTVSKPLREAYPDLMSLQRNGLITEKERQNLERAATEENPTPRPLLVIDWIQLLARETSTHERYVEKSSHAKVIEMVSAFKKSCGYIIKFSTKNIPNAMIQASIIIVYSYGVLTLMSRSLEETEQNEFTAAVISYVPLVPSLQFFIFLTWLNFGRAAVNPFGTDSTDINIKSLAESHIRDSMRLAKLYSKNLDDCFSDTPQQQYQYAMTPISPAETPVKKN